MKIERNEIKENKIIMKNKNMKLINMKYENENKISL